MTPVALNSGPSWDGLLNSAGGVITMLFVLIGSGVILALIGAAVTMAAGGRLRGRQGPPSEKRDHWPWGT